MFLGNVVIRICLGHLGEVLTLSAIKCAIGTPLLVTRKIKLCSWRSTIFPLQLTESL